MLKRIALYLLATQFLLSFGWAQSAADLQQNQSAKENPPSTLHLIPLETVLLIRSGISFPRAVCM